ncbi:hypothetical protein LELG_00070 [Lodderomyces elongisporus NRRL YB-4239]|uniref:C2H2-type domain-containing protein n=1 Tax=Lodderomyces elongisporus (strain ATCC 11503 / CBS 2605 / JCM 1781 / NBRC 1676 / NRRL YB-4239) TaxID=379508 RepID=A5DRT4_LODEL|nr:hypothetical protein LELG_00070 [Lodderomyces elongisporus NRRL YB-4239]
MPGGRKETDGSGGIEKPKRKASTSVSSSAVAAAAATAATTTTSSSSNTSASASTPTSTSTARKLPPLASLQSVYRSDYQPFTTFLPYEPAFRDNHGSTSSNAAEETSSDKVKDEAKEKDEIADKPTQQASPKAKTPPSMEASITKFRATASPTSTAKIEKAVAMAASAASAAARTQASHAPQAVTTPTLNSTTVSTTNTDASTKSPASANSTAVATTTTTDPQIVAATTKHKPYACTFPKCEWSFARQSDLTRHAKSHAAPQYHCPYWKNDPTCHKNYGAFNRLDVLKRHLRLVHYVKDKQPIINNSSDNSNVDEGLLTSTAGQNGGAHSSSNSSGGRIGGVGAGIAGGRAGVDDPGWCRACQRMFPNSKAFVEHCQDCAQNTQPAEWIENKRTYANTVEDGSLHQNTFRVIIDQKQTKS